MTLVTFSGRRPSQMEAELRGFVDLMLARGVRRYGEIGARHGDTFHYVLTALGASGVALDLPGGLWGHSDTGKALQRAVADLRDRELDASYLWGDSRDPSMQAQFRAKGPYDAILIDGDHTLEGVTADWEAYRSFAPLIAFHDIVGEGQRERVSGRRVEVPKLWASIKQRGYNTVEFVAPGSKMGIGCVLLE